jgi:replicative DNA helicase
MIAGTLRNTFVMLAQVNRSAGSEADRPEVYHLRGSGGIEQGADMIAMMHRPDRSEPQGEIFIAKDRGGVAGDRYEIRMNTWTLKIT